MKVDDWLELARLLAIRPGFVAAASKNRVEAGRFMGVTDPLLQMKAHDLAQSLAAGKSFAEYERLERIDQKSIRAHMNASTALFIAVPLVPMGALLAFATSDGEASWFFWACALAGAIAAYGFAEKGKADRLLAEVAEADHLQRR